MINYPGRIEIERRFLAHRSQRKIKAVNGFQDAKTNETQYLGC
jgi:hypothetical protein